MLKNLLESKIRKEGISIREASRQIGVAHTTVIRILEGQHPNLATLHTITEWLGVDADIVTGFGTDDELATKLIAILKQEPDLVEPLKKALAKYEEGVLDNSDVQDIVSYIGYRLSQKSQVE